MIVPGAPHHVTQRGNRREPIFLEPGDEAIYLDLLVKPAADWPWSSAASHIAGQSTRHVIVEPALSRIGDFAAFVDARDTGVETLWSDVLKAERIGRPVGAREWVRELEQRLGQDLSPRKRGPKPKAAWTDEGGGLPPFGN